MGNHINNLVFQPPPVSYGSSRRPLLWLRTVRGSHIPAFYLDRKAKITILFSHGNAEDLGLIFEWMVLVSAELSVNVLAYDYDGYGKSVQTGFSVSEAGNGMPFYKSFNFLNYLY